MVKPLKKVKQNFAMMDACPVCQSKQYRDVLWVQQVPILSNYFWDSKEEAMRSPRGDIALSFCPDCAHLFNRAYDPTRVVYQPGYENSLFGSPRFINYADQLARRLVKSLALKGKIIVEIGSGDGEFLRMLCSLGGNQGVGYDPAHPQGEGVAGPGRIRWVSANYQAEPSMVTPDLVCCRHVLEHLPDPVDFIQLVRQANANVFFEVPNALYTLRELGIWDIIYEHPSLFTPSSLEHLFIASGFMPLEVEEVYGRQFLTILAKPVDPIRQAEQHKKRVSVKNEAVDPMLVGFAEKYRTTVQKWKNKITNYSNAGEKIVLWGSGSKGVTFLNIAAQDGPIQYVVDINLRKQGRYVSCTGQVIVPPDFLTNYQPDLVLVMNPLYRGEVQSALCSLGVAARVDVVEA